jgi:hypothetical protein
MRTILAVALTAASVAPVLGLVGIDWLHAQDVQRVADGEDVSNVAQDIARREFSGNVTMRLVDDVAAPNATDEFNDTIRADDGFVYRSLTLDVANRGRLDVSVHTYHFAVFDDSGRRWKAQLGIQQKFEVMQLRSGESAEGTVVFEVPKDDALARVFWQGELYNATLDLT